MNVELVTVDRAFARLADPAVREAFFDMQRVRSAAYAADYGDGFNPFDGSDFIARHHVFYLRTADEGGIEQRLPVASFKLVELSACDAYGIELPVIRFFAQAQPHVRVLHDLVADYRISGRALLYTGSWGVLKSHRSNRHLMLRLSELVAAVMADELVRRAGHGIGVPLEPKTKRFWSRMGWRSLHFKGEALSSVPHTCDPEQRFGLSVITEPSAEAMRCLETHASTLDERRWL